VYLEHHRHGFTIRWRRGDPVAYVLAGKRLDDHGMTDVLDTIPVPVTGWTNLTEIRTLGERLLCRR
jgi:hypothetical protein